MAWTNLGTVAPGDVLRASSGTAAYNNVIGNLYMGQPTFTNEAARDAVITAPTEGMTAYLTAPTVPAATGETPAIPTGITTIYNGSVWVCTSEVGAYTSNVGTRNASAYSASLGGTPGTNPSVTLTTGTSAKVTLRVGFLGLSVGSGAAARMSVAVSGSSTIAASNARSIIVGNDSTFIGAATTFIIPGLTGGTNTFTLQYSASSGTATYEHREIIVQGIA
jgi:hypothetical protein